MKFYIMLYSNNDGDGWTAAVIDTTTGGTIYELPSYNTYSTPEKAIGAIREAGFNI